MLLIGLTGERGVGKSEFTNHVREMYNFGVSHAFEVGKRLTVHFYVNELQIPHHIAVDMVHGKLKDTPSPYLPNNDTSRRFMEELGYCLGSKMGPDWTLGIELQRIKNDNRLGYILDSVVYESDYFIKAGGIIIRIEREDRDKTIDAVRTSEAQKNVPYHVLLKNNASLECFKKNISFLMANLLDWKSRDVLNTQLSFYETDTYVVGEGLS